MERKKPDSLEKQIGPEAWKALQDVYREKLHIVTVELAKEHEAIIEEGESGLEKEMIAKDLFTQRTRRIEQLVRDDPRIQVQFARKKSLLERALSQRYKASLESFSEDFSSED